MTDKGDKRGQIVSNEITTVMGVNLGVALDKRMLSWLGAIAVELVVMIVVAVVFLVPQVNQWGELRANIKKEEKLLESKTNKVQLISDLSAVMAGRESVLRMALPANKDIGLLLSSLRQQSAQVGVRMESYTLNPGEVSGTVESKNKKTTVENGLPIELTVSGQIDGLRRFLDVINASLPIKKVDNVQVVSGEQQGEVRLKLKLVMYFMPFDEKVVAGNPLRQLAASETDLLAEMQNYVQYNQEGDGGANVPLGNNDLFGP